MSAREPDVPDGVQRFLWEADQLAYEPWGSAPTDNGARLLAPLGEYIRVDDLPVIRKQERQRVREALVKVARFIAQTDDQTEFGGELEVALVRRSGGDLHTVSDVEAALDSLEAPQ